MRWLRISGLGLLLLLLLPSAARAQRVPVREGFWVSFGLGGGWADDTGSWTNEADVFEDTPTGFATYVRLGGSPSQKLLVGGEVIGWLATEELSNTDVFRGQFQAVGLYYPSETGGLFLKGGIGLAGRTLDTTLDIGGNRIRVSQESEGLGLDVGAGWELQLARNFFLAPNVDLLYQFLGDDQSGWAVLLTVGATWH